MRKLFVKLLVIVAMFTALCCSKINYAEAANFTALRLVNSVPDRGEFDQIYYDIVIDSVKKQNQYNFVDGDRIESAINKNTVSGKLASETALRAIAKEADLDLVCALEITSIETERLNSKEEDMIQLEMRGMFISYNALEDKFTAHKIHESEKVIETLTTRGNWLGQKFGLVVTREMHRVLGIKKEKLYKQTVGFRN